LAQKRKEKKRHLALRAWKKKKEGNYIYSQARPREERALPARAKKGEGGKATHGGEKKGKDPAFFMIRREGEGGKAYF